MSGPAVCAKCHHHARGKAITMADLERHADARGLGDDPATEGGAAMSAREVLGSYVWESTTRRPREPIWWGADVPRLTPAQALEVWGERLRMLRRKAGPS